MLEVQLDLERLRAERDALAAELQIERAERVRTEERLRLFEREKLEQMRDGAASREKLASELEEARLRAMRAEARQAVLEADVRLSEIAERRRGWPAPDPGAGADDVREPDSDPDDSPPPEPDPEPEPDRPRPRRLGNVAQMPEKVVSKYSRPLRSSASPARGAGSRPSAPSRGDRDDAAGGGDGVDAERGNAPRESGGAERQRPGASGPESRWSPSRQPAGATAPPPRDAAKSGSPQAGRGGPGSAKGGAAAGRPSIDRTQLEARLAAGQTIELTERFRQFQPVAQSHLKICDWLGRARTLDEIDALAQGEVARTEIIAVLTLFFERSFLVFK